MVKELEPKFVRNIYVGNRHAWKLYQKRLCSCYLLLRGGGEGVAWNLLSGGMFTVNLHSGAMVGGVRPFPGKEV